MNIANNETHPEHYYWLDLLRFIAAFTVVVTHTRSSVFVEFGALQDTDKGFLVAAGYAITRVGNEAVILFFVLSGFLVGGRALSRIAHGTFKPIDYAIDRFVRISLPLVPALILTALIHIIVDGDFSASELLGNLLSLQGIWFRPFGGNGPLWSLSYEVWFYTLAFAVGVACTKTTFYFPSYILLVVVLVVFTSLSPVYLFCWLIGALAYVRMPRRFSMAIIYLSIAIICYSIVAIQLGYDTVSLSASHLRSYVPSLNVSRLILSAGVALIIQHFSLIRPTGHFAYRISKVGTGCAAFSYTLYLTHYPMLRLISNLGVTRAKQITIPAMTNFVCAIFICLLTAWLMYLLFERHTSKVKYLIKYKCVSGFNNQVQHPERKDKGLPWENSTNS